VLSLPLVGRHCSHFAAGWALPALSAPRRKEGLRECALRAVRRKAVAAVAGGRCSRWIKPSGAQSPLVSLPLSFKSAHQSAFRRRGLARTMRAWLARSITASLDLHPLMVCRPLIRQQECVYVHPSMCFPPPPHSPHSLSPGSVITP